MDLFSFLNPSPTIPSNPCDADLSLAPTDPSSFVGGAKSLSPSADNNTRDGINNPTLAPMSFDRQGKDNVIGSAIFHLIRVLLDESLSSPDSGTLSKAKDDGLCL